MKIQNKIEPVIEVIEIESSSNESSEDMDDLEELIDYYNQFLSRIKTIMRSSADVESISRESLLVVTLATELFIEHLAKGAEAVCEGKELQYKHIAEVVNTSERYDFLTEIIPKKITVREFKKLLAEKKANEQLSDESNTETTENEESDSSISSGSEENQSEDDSEHNSSTHSGPETKQ